MENRTQILLRSSKRQANLYDSAASIVGLSRNAWILKTLDERLAQDREIDLLGPTTLRASITTQLFLETWLAPQLGKELVHEIRAKADVLTNKWGGLQ